jgi:hypothetical protein
MGKGAPVPMDMMAQFLDMPEDIKQQMIQGIQAQDFRVRHDGNHEEPRIQPSGND